MTEQNPALVPEPEQPQEKMYIVSGQHAVLDHQPGETFTATLDPEQERNYLEYGHLQLVNTQGEQDTPESSSAT